MLIDARNGVLTQSRRHGFIIVPAAGAPRARGRQQDGPGRLRPGHLPTHRRGVSSVSPQSSRSATCVPAGQRPARRQRHGPQRSGCPGTRGPTLLHTWRTCTWPPTATSSTSASRCSTSSARTPFRGFAGRIASGTIRPGRGGRGAAVRARIDRQVDRDLRRPAGRGVRAPVRRADAGRRDRRQPRRHAGAPRQPAAGRAPALDATLCWMERSPAARRARPTCSSTRRRRSRPSCELLYRIDVNTLHRETAGELTLNEIGRVEIRRRCPSSSIRTGQPRHRHLHPHRPGHQPHGGRRA